MHPESGNLYVALFEFSRKSLAYLEFDTNGEICILNEDGKKLGRVAVPGYPELTSLAFNSYDGSSLIAIDSKDTCTMLSIEVKETNLEKSERDRAS